MPDPEKSVHGKASARKSWCYEILVQGNLSAGKPSAVTTWKPQCEYLGVAFNSRLREIVSLLFPFVVISQRKKNQRKKFRAGISQGPLPGVAGRPAGRLLQP